MLTQHRSENLALQVGQQFVFFWAGGGGGGQGGAGALCWKTGKGEGPEYERRVFLAHSHKPFLLFRVRVNPGLQHAGSR